ncbi:MAG: hypothetical protein VX288_04620, partial [Planctomycetota bacterium]|nr:hypothetical protein [Planctomycetota bacterium]
KAFKQDISDFYTPRAHRREPLVLADIDQMPIFEFDEEQDSEWLARVGSGLAGIFVFSSIIGAWALLSLRPRKLGLVAG